MNKELVRVQMNSDILKEAEKIFKQNNLSPSEAITLLYQNILLKPELPFSIWVSQNE